MRSSLRSHPQSNLKPASRRGGNMSKPNWVTRACGIFLLWATAAVALPAQTFTTVYSFCARIDCADGFEPSAGLVQGTDAMFYGTTQHGGTNGYGTVFGITAGGELTSLHSFDS